MHDLQHSLKLPAEKQASGYSQIMKDLEIRIVAPFKF